MKLIDKKFLILLVMSVIVIISFFIFDNSTAHITKTIGMARMVIEEKHHHNEPGQYLEMWIIGYNPHENKEDPKRYKIYIEESMVYNLIEVGSYYMINATSFKEDEDFGLVYKLDQISNQIEYQLAGKGRIK